MKKRKIKNTRQLLYVLVIAVILIIAEYIANNIEYKEENNIKTTSTVYLNIEDISDYTGEIFVTINDNKPIFSEEEYSTNSFENYSELDALGRCGVAFANICKETMPPEGDERGSISSVHPTGWKQVKYNGEYLYNRCHLIAYMLSDEDANELNLITGTRYFNVQGMLPFEQQVADYINKNENNHVLYRVTPVFKGNNLLASGVEMEAYSVEDNGEGVCFNVYIYNVQPGVSIDYATGELQN